MNFIDSASIRSKILNGKTNKMLEKRRDSLRQKVSAMKNKIQQQQMAMFSINKTIKKNTKKDPSTANSSMLRQSMVELTGHSKKIRGRKERCSLGRRISLSGKLEQKQLTDEDLTLESSDAKKEKKKRRKKTQKLKKSISRITSGSKKFESLNKGNIKLDISHMFQSKTSKLANFSLDWTGNNSFNKTKTLLGEGKGILKKESSFFSKMSSKKSIMRGGSSKKVKFCKKTTVYRFNTSKFRFEDSNSFNPSYFTPSHHVRYKSGKIEC